jgi:hypothetical protein
MLCKMLILKSLLWLPTDTQEFLSYLLWVILSFVQVVDCVNVLAVGFGWKLLAFFLGDECELFLGNGRGITGFVKETEQSCETQVIIGQFALRWTNLLVVGF